MNRFINVGRVAFDKVSLWIVAAAVCVAVTLFAPSCQTDLYTDRM